MPKKVEVTPLEKALYLIERGHFPLDTDPIKLAKTIEERAKNIDAEPEILNDVNTVYHEK